MFVDKLYNFIVFLKNQGQSRYFTPEEVQDALNRAIMDKYENDYAEFETSQKLSDALSAFKRELDVSKADDRFKFPEKYRHLTDLGCYNTEDEEIEAVMLTDGEFLKKKNSSFLPPTEEYPFYRTASWNESSVYVRGVEAIPDTISKVKMYYLKEPDEAVYAYTMVNDRPVFDEGNSVDPEFPEFVHNHLIVQTLKYLGVPLKDNVLMTFENIQPQKNG